LLILGHYVMYFWNLRTAGLKNTQKIDKITSRGDLFHAFLPKRCREHAKYIEMQHFMSRSIKTPQMNRNP